MTRGRHHITELLEDTLDLIESAGSRREPKPAPRLAGIPSGFADLDALLGRLRPGLVHLVFGYPAAGKSTLAANAASSAARTGERVLYLSAQSPAPEIIQRLLSAEGKVPLHHLRAGTLTENDWNRLAKATEALSTWSLEIDDTPYTDFSHVGLNAHADDAQYGLVVVDGTNLYARHTAPESLWAAQTRVAADIKRSAAETGAAFIVTVPVNRRMDQRVDFVPQLVDIASSAAHAADADVAVAVHRPDLFEKESPRAGEADLIVLKNRYGPTATITVAFQGHYARFIDIAPLP